MTHKYTELTTDQKLSALSSRFYANVEWIPKAGDYYTTARNDLELYRVIKIEDGTVYTVYCHTENCEPAMWPENGFTTLDFGQRRVWVPEWILSRLP